ncbi:carbonic anhydrase [Herbaspirillum rhizosphaerae]|uniref:carbonic anhydrase n=1 Tax=Herbaspirillum rhizosphaerae TaxID=346179 RepID=UPI00067CE25F|nr:carbonic anhydrase [Herbaspirillum rhizosphaerae]
MDFIETLIQRNAEFATTAFSAGMKILPSRRTLILGCVDPRVDPMDVLQLQAGEAAVIRNVGGRVNPSLLETMSLLRTVSKAGGEPIGSGWNFVVLHHTKCGIAGCYRHAPALLAQHMGVTEGKALDALAITDPYASVAMDVAALKANPDFADDLQITGLVYDVDTGLIEVVAPTAPARTPAA